MGVCDPLPVDVDRFNHIHVVLFTDADTFEPKEPLKEATTMDKWEGEDEDENIKVNERWRLWAEAFVCRGHRHVAGPFEPDQPRL